MMKIILVLIIIICGFYFRSRFEKRFVSPVLSENKNLNKFRKLAFSFVLLAVLAFFLKLIKIAFIILVLLIPVVLYLNYKIYSLVNLRYKDEKQKNKKEIYERKKLD